MGYQAGRSDEYFEGVAEDIKGEVFHGLNIPGSAFSSKSEFDLLGQSMSEYMDIHKFEPKNFVALPNNDVMFNVDWEFTWKPSGKVVETTAVVRKVLKDGMICEKYHMIDCADVLED